MEDALQKSQVKINSSQYVVRKKNKTQKNPKNHTTKTKQFN